MTVYRGHGLPTIALLLAFGGVALIASHDYRFFGYELARDWAQGIGAGCMTLGCVILGKIINVFAAALLDNK